MLTNSSNCLYYALLTSIEAFYVRARVCVCVCYYISYNITVIVSMYLETKETCHESFRESVTRKVRGHDNKKREPTGIWLNFTLCYEQALFQLKLST